MQIHRISYGVKGFVRLARYAIRWTRMVQDKAKHKARVLKFWADHGIKATLEAFGVKQRTLYHWKAQLKKGEGRLEALNEKSKRPHRVRVRQWSLEITQEIRRLRTEHPNLGKEKIHPFIQTFCDARAWPCPKPKTVGRIIASAPESEFQTKEQVFGGTRFARPTLWRLLYLFLQNWSVFTTSLELTLSKIRE